MGQTFLRRRSYDHRIRQIVCETGNPTLFRHIGIPRSTAASWISRGCRAVVSLDQNEEIADIAALLAENHKLKQRARRLTAIIRLLVTLLKISGFRLDEQRLPDGAAKARILSAVERCRDALPLRSALRLLRLSSARFHAWRHAQQTCELKDRSSCPRTHPTQLLPNEVLTIKEMVTASEYRHMPLRTLALYAQRIGKVFASATTWAKLVRQRGWRRPRRRVYPAKPKVGIRATAPNDFWHIDVTVIKLLDGTKTYLHAVIDNFSRRILSWRVVDRLGPTTTCEILLEAAKNVDHKPSSEPPTVVADSGIENVNGEVDDLVETGLLRRVLAQVEVSYSNSMIEAFWRSLRHQWLYLNALDSVAALERLVSFYVGQHNEVMPHAAFGGQTPDEIYFGRGSAVIEDLAAARATARRARAQENRRESCGVCTLPGTNESASDPVAVANATPD